MKQSRDLALLSQEMHVNTRRMESKNRNEDFEKLFEGRDFPFESFPMLPMLFLDECF